MHQKISAPGSPSVPEVDKLSGPRAAGVIRLEAIDLQSWGIDRRPYCRNMEEDKSLTV